MRDHSSGSDERTASSSAPNHRPTPALRQLPPRPSLEYERKQAKTLRDELRRGDSGALRRVEAVGVTIDAGREVQLADAQFVIAREYGFRSWPRLVDYFTTLERHIRAGPRPFPDPRSYEHSVPSILQGHKARNAGTAQLLGTFVPRFYGATTDEILASDVTIDDARLVVARQYLCPTWDVLVEQPATPGWTGFESFEAPVALARYAIKNGDLRRLKELVDTHPDLLHATGTERGPAENLMANAVSAEVENPSATAVAITDWLSGRSLDAVRAWSRYLLGQPFQKMPAEHVEHALRRGADPHWLPPSGISILEHAIFRYWNGAAVDRIAARVKVPDVFWIAAGVGDIQQVRRFLDRDGKPTAAARRHRPDFTAMSVSAGSILPSLPEASDNHILWEACLLAGYNSRFDVIDLLIDSGFPVDYTEIGFTILQYAVQWRLVDLIEHLVARGADPDRGVDGGYSARATAEAWIQHGATVEPAIVSILRALGGDPDSLIRKREQRESKPAVMGPELGRTLQQARRNAARRGRSFAEPDDLLVALLRETPAHVLHYFAESGGDITRIRKAIDEHASADAAETSSAEVPFADATTLLLAEAQALAERHHRDHVRHTHVLWALTVDETTGPFSTVLGAAPETIRKLRTRLDRL